MISILSNSVLNHSHTTISLQNQNKQKNILGNKTTITQQFPHAASGSVGRIIPKRLIFLDSLHMPICNLWFPDVFGLRNTF